MTAFAKEVSNMKDDQLYAVKMEGTNATVRALGKEWKQYAAANMSNT